MALKYTPELTNNNCHDHGMDCHQTLRKDCIALVMGKGASDCGKATDKDGPIQIGAKAADGKHTNDISTQRQSSDKVALG